MKNKKWCRHITWNNTLFSIRGDWVLYMKFHGGWHKIDQHWKCCPICMTLRPKKLSKFKETQQQRLKELQRQRSEYGVYQ